MTSPTLADAPARGLPPLVGRQLDAPPLHPRGWARTIAPAFLGVVTWFPLLDALGAVGRADESALGRWPTCLLALGGCYVLIYLPLARLGLRTRRPLTVAAADALGADGAEWIAGVLYGLVAAIWGSVAIWYSVRMTLDGLSAWGMFSQPSGDAFRLMGVPLEKPIVLASLAWWTLIILAANGLNLLGVIEAMMRVYSPFAGLLVVATALWAWWRGAAAPGGPWPMVQPEPRTFQFLFAAFAFAGLSAVDWGAAVRDRRDVRVGGWLSILAAGAATTLAALVLGTTSLVHGSAWSGLTSGAGRWIDRWTAGGLLLLLGLASLAPAIYAAALFTRRFQAHWPSMGKWTGAGLSGLLLFAPGAIGLAGRVEAVAVISGALFAPLAGVLAVEALGRRRDGEEAVRPGWNAAGVFAWGLGTLVGLAPTLLDSSRFQPAALFGWLTAAGLHLVLSRLVRARRP